MVLKYHKLDAIIGLALFLHLFISFSFRGYFPTICNVDPLDWKTQSTKRIVRSITKHIEPGDVILLHDVYPTSVEAALEVIDTLTKQGYSFVTVDELLID